MRFICAMLVLCGLFLPANAQTKQEPPAVPVGVVTAERKPVNKALDFVGRVEGINRSEVKARVPGYLEGIHEASDKGGSPLYSIERTVRGRGGTSRRRIGAARLPRS
jgi:membrane fusion protein (multidrug efflux system)